VRPSVCPAPQTSITSPSARCSPRKSRKHRSEIVRLFRERVANSLNTVHDCQLCVGRYAIDELRLTAEDLDPAKVLRKHVECVRLGILAIGGLCIASEKLVKKPSSMML